MRSSYSSLSERLLRYFGGVDRFTRGSAFKGVQHGKRTAALTPTHMVEERISRGRGNQVGQGDNRKPSGPGGGREKTERYPS